MVKKNMIVGMTYDLKDDYLKAGFSKEQAAEFDSLETIDGIANSIEQMGLTVKRIGNIKSLMSVLMAGEKPDIVFNIAEGAYGLGREAQVPALLEAFQIPYTFSGTDVLSLALHKAMTLAVVKANGVRTAKFKLVSSMEDVEHVHMPYPLFVKPVAEGTSKGINSNSKVNSKKELKAQCRYVLETFHQPALVETYLPGREFTVGILGSGTDAEPLGVMEVLFNKKDTAGYCYDSKQNYTEAVKYKLVDEPEVTELALKAWRVLGCLDAGRIDVRMDELGRPCFLEVNPLAGLNPVVSDLSIMAGLKKIPYPKLIERIMSSALKRTRLI